MVSDSQLCNNTEVQKQTALLILSNAIYAVILKHYCMNTQMIYSKLKEQ